MTDREAAVPVAPPGPAALAAAVDSGEVRAAADRLWLDVLDALVGRAAHEVNNALNGVAVNVEVVRGRSGRAGLEASALASFAEAAGTQLEGLVVLTESLLALARTPRGPVSLGAQLDRLVPLAAAVAAKDGHLVVAERAGPGPTVAAPAEAVRGVLGAGLLATLDHGGDVRCTILADPRPTVRIAVAPAREGAVLRLPAAAVRAARLAGIEARCEAETVILTFPAAGE